MNIAKWNWQVIMVAIKTIYKLNINEKKMIFQYCFDSSECFYHIWIPFYTACITVLHNVVFLHILDTHTNSFEMKILIVFYLCMCNSVLFWNKHVYLSFNLPTYTVHCISFKASSSLFFWYKGQTILQKVCNHTS